MRETRSLPDVSLISSTAASPRSLSRPATTTSAPIAASAVAAALPMPEVPPVIRTTAPFSTLRLRASLVSTAPWLRRATCQLFCFLFGRRRRSRAPGTICHFEDWRSKRPALHATGRGES